MACFLVSTGEAAVVTAIHHKVKKSELERGIVDEQGKQLTSIAEHGYCWTTKLSWLMTMLWGGVLLLLIEHIWHGEVVFFPPFLTAMSNPADTAEMLFELATTGTGMAALVTLVWAVSCLVADKLARLRTQASLEA